jgi:hypothetical protein
MLYQALLYLERPGTGAFGGTIGSPRVDINVIAPGTFFLTLMLFFGTNTVG